MKPLPLCLLVLGLVALPCARANDLLPPTSESVARTIIDLSGPDAKTQAQPSHDQVTLAPASGGAGLEVAIAAGPAGYPGVNFAPVTGVFDLSGTGYVEARITNTG